ncbi:hypothetical protein [Halobacteriovorax sp. JY17]|uniref:hypothetical protein n=1 Tax=Halobacteriovorax sp. JY17 TaxID=2014617 RepID=UPI000C429F15|nr:hypothetical protein [Halobacteriovorax sp. JY17]PIK16410.1 MAG: hypothetical protein CES88_06630 [Halobacteriovorax sp. JY17]
MSKANRIGFRNFFKSIGTSGHVDLIIDANVIIAAKDKNHKDHSLVREFFNDLKNKTQSYTLFTTVTTKAEFLEYCRRMIITKAIISAYNSHNEEQILTSKCHQEIQSQIRARNYRQNKEVQKQEQLEKKLEAEGFDTLEYDIKEFSIDANYFKDSEIKNIKKAFRARTIENELGWIKLCEDTLLPRLEKYEQILDDMCHYLTTRDIESKKFFTEGEVQWRMATQICAETAMGYSDAMILNMANHTSIKHIFSLDYDIVYGGHISAKDKIIIVPDKRLKHYKQTLKGL